MKISIIKINAKNPSINEIQKYSYNEPDINTSEITFLPVIESPNKIICVGMNYAEKRIELNSAPTLFVRFADSQTGHKTDIIKPHNSSEFDYEGELAVIIGSECTKVDEADAMSHVGCTLTVCISSDIYPHWWRIHRNRGFAATQLACLIRF